MGVVPMSMEAPGREHPGIPKTADAPRTEWPGKPEEFGSLVDAYTDRLFRYAARRLGSVQDAEDVVQEVFARAYQGLNKRPDIACAGAYLYRMTANACTDVLRQRQRAGNGAAPLSLDSAALPDPHGSPLELARAAEEALRTEQLLRRLPKAQAEAVRLRVFGELSLREIADTAGCSVHTANSRLRYGFKRLRRIVAREWKT